MRRAGLPGARRTNAKAVNVTRNTTINDWSNRLMVYLIINLASLKHYYSSAPMPVQDAAPYAQTPKWIYRIREALEVPGQNKRINTP
jgi:hypothetical protein